MAHPVSSSSTDPFADAYYSATLDAEAIVVNGIERYFHHEACVRLVGGKKIANRIWSELDFLLHLPLIANAQEVLGMERYLSAEARWIARNPDKVDA